MRAQEQMGREVKCHPSSPKRSSTGGASSRVRSLAPACVFHGVYDAAISSVSQIGPPVRLVLCLQRETVIALFVLLANKRWWVDISACQPQLLGLERAAVQFIEQAEGISSPWSRDKVAPTVALAPCGMDCLQ
jgi:hypothetical protein